MEYYGTAAIVSMILDAFSDAEFFFQMIGKHIFWASKTKFFWGEAGEGSPPPCLRCCDVGNKHISECTPFFQLAGNLSTHI
jgi:hypothetical protein